MHTRLHRKLAALVGEYCDIPLYSSGYLKLKKGGQVFSLFKCTDERDEAPGETHGYCFLVVDPGQVILLRPDQREQMMSSLDVEEFAGMEGAPSDLFYIPFRIIEKDFRGLTGEDFKFN